MERVRLIPHHLQLHARTMRGRVDSVTWRLPDDLSKEEWVEAGIVLARIGAGMMWWVGDFWIYGEKKYGDRKAIVDDPNWQGPSFQTCANAASVCRAFETSRRREVLSFAHHAEVAALDVKEADRLLDWATTNPTTGKPRSTKDLRREVRRNLEKVRRHRSQKLVGKEASIAKLEAARAPQPSAQPSAASGIRTATIRQLIDALVVWATGKPDFEIALIVSEITKRLNELKAHTPARLPRGRS